MVQPAVSWQLGNVCEKGKDVRKAETFTHLLSGVWTSYCGLLNELSCKTIWGLSCDLVLMKLPISWSNGFLVFIIFFLFSIWVSVFSREWEMSESAGSIERTLKDHEAVSLPSGNITLKPFLTGCCFCVVWKLSWKKSGRNATACLFSMSLLNKLWAYLCLNFCFKFLTNVMMIS